MELPPDPERDAVGQAMADVAVACWRDLWARLDQYRTVFADLHVVLGVLDRAMRDLERSGEVLHGEARKTHTRRLRRARSLLEQVRSTVPTIDQEATG